MFRPHAAHTHEPAFYHFCLSLRPPDSLSHSAFLRVRLTCRRNVGRASAVLLARTLPPISSPLHPLSLFCTSFPLASALFVPFLCPLFLLSSRLSLRGAQFSFLLAAARSFCPNSRRSQTSFHFASFAYRSTICSFSIIFPAIDGNNTCLKSQFVIYLVHSYLEYFLLH